MLLNNILYGVPLQAVAGNMDIVVSNIVFDSRLVSKGDVFVAVKGTLADGHKYIDKAIDSGAMAIEVGHWEYGVFRVEGLLIVFEVVVLDCVVDVEAVSACLGDSGGIV